MLLFIEAGFLTLIISLKKKMKKYVLKCRK